MSFDVGWLDLREAADRAAKDLSSSSDTATMRALAQRLLGDPLVA